MATVHTEYGPGRIIDRETVRGRTRVKVAGEGFEVWLDAAKVGAYESPADYMDQPHWDGHRDTDPVPRSLPPVPSDYDEEPSYGDRHTLRRHPDYLSEDDPDARYARRRHAGPEDDYAAEEMRGLSRGDYEGYDDEDDPGADYRGLAGDPGLSFDDDADARYARRRRQARTLDEAIADEDDDPYAERYDPEDIHGLRHRLHIDEFADDDPARYSSRRSPGKGEAHLAWAPLDDSNSTELPYNPSPQHQAIGTPGDDGSSTIQPIHHIDADERLTPANSITFEQGSEDTPGPSRDLFASTRREAISPIPLLMMGLPALNKAEDMIGDYASGSWQGEQVANGINSVDGLINKGLDFFTPGPGWGDLHKDSSYRPAGLGDRYIDLTASVDYWNDPVAQFRHDPDEYINRLGHLMDEGLNPRFAEYMDLVEADSGIRTAAWKDVRKKAMRLKREGHVTVKDIAPNRIMASVVGDHGTYDVVILKNGSFGGLSEGNPGHAISNWHCGCEWGRWAFRRKFTYVGRLCSHAYASYLTMQSAALKGKPRQQKGPQRKKPTRGLPVVAPGLRRRHSRLVEADALQNGPTRLTPDLVVNDADDAHMFVDVTKDERKDVGPDDVMSEKDIVHFARLMRHCEVTEQPYPRELVAFLSRYAGCADDSSDDTQADYEAHGATDANEYLEKIRSDADRKQEEDFGNMAERVHRVQDAVEEARAHGVDADRFVAMVRQAAPGDEQDRQQPQQPQVPPGMTLRSGPASTLWGWNDLVENSPLRIDRVGRPGENGAGGVEFQDIVPGRAVMDPDEAGKDDEGGRKTPNWQPNEGQTEVKYGPTNKPGEGDFGNPGGGAKNNGGGANNGGGGSANNGGGGGAGSGAGGAGGGDGGYTAPGGGQTSGNVTDGGKAGAENGNNAAITKDMLDADGNYTMQAGDTLTDVAQRATGDMNKYQDIAKANSGITNVDDIAVGTKVNLKDFATETGNNGMAGNITNPAGGGADGDIATVDAVGAPSAGDDADAVGSAAVAGANAGTSLGAGVGGKVDTSAAGGSGGGGAAVDAVTPPAQPPTPGDTGSAGQDTGAGSFDKKITSTRSARWWLQKMAAEPQTGTGAEDPSQPQQPTSNGSSTPSSTKSTSPGAQPASNPATSTNPSSTSSDPNAKQIQPNPDTETYDPNDPASQAQQSQSAANPAMAAGTATGTPGNQFDTSGMDALSTGLGAASDIASGIGGAMPAIGDAISGIASGIGSIFASKNDFDDWVRYAYPTADGECDLEPHTHPFAGSGYPGPLEFGTSEEYADKARKKMDDVTDLGDGDLTTPMGDWQKQGATSGKGADLDAMGFGDAQDGEPGSWGGRFKDLPDDDDDDSYREASIGYSTDDNSDIVRRFQAHLGDTALGSGAGSGSGRFDDFASAAQGFLRTAGRNYSLAEQSELIREGDKGGARNLDSLDLTGTHYEDMHTLGW